MFYVDLDAFVDSFFLKWFLTIRYSNSRQIQLMLLIQGSSLWIRLQRQLYGIYAADVMIPCHCKLLSFYCEIIEKKQKTLFKLGIVIFVVFAVSFFVCNPIVIE